MKLTSSVFFEGESIPLKHTGEGEDFSPQLEWSEIPDHTHEFVLICEDPDAPKRIGADHPFVHWVIYNISPSVTMLPEGLLPQGRLEAPVLADQGVNSFGKIGYSGPMPPVGHGRHRYVFTLYALNCELGLPPGATKAQLLKAMNRHVLASAKLIGTYERKRTRRAA